VRKRNPLTPILLTPEQTTTFANFEQAYSELFAAVIKANPSEGYCRSFIFINLDTNYSTTPYTHTSRFEYHWNIGGREGEAKSMGEALDKCFSETELEIAKRQRKDLLDKARSVGREIRKLEGRA
jgi:hypothetical protein